jgi:hypothetical protein
LRISIALIAAGVVIAILSTAVGTADSSTVGSLVGLVVGAVGLTLLAWTRILAHVRALPKRKVKSSAFIGLLLILAGWLVAASSSGSALARPLATAIGDALIGVGIIVVMCALMRMIADAVM